MTTRSTIPRIDSTMTYIKRAKEIRAASADAKTYSENLKAAFPDRQLARSSICPPATYIRRLIERLGESSA